MTTQPTPIATWPTFEAWAKDRAPFLLDPIEEHEDDARLRKTLAMLAWEAGRASAATPLTDQEISRRWAAELAHSARAALSRLPNTPPLPGGVTHPDGIEARLLEGAGNLQKTEDEYGAHLMRIAANYAHEAGDLLRRSLPHIAVAAASWHEDKHANYSVHVDKCLDLVKEIKGLLLRSGQAVGPHAEAPEAQ